QNLRWIKDLVDTQLPQHLYGRRRGHVVTDNQVQTCVDDLARYNSLTSTVRRKDLFSNGHAHDVCLSTRSFQEAVLRRSPLAPEYWIPFCVYPIWHVRRRPCSKR